MREYPGELTQGVVLNQGEIELYTRYSVLVSKEKESKEWEYTLLKYMAENRDSLQNISFFDKGRYNGTVYTLNLEGDLLNVKVFADGKQMAVVKDRKKGVLS